MAARQRRGQECRQFLLVCEGFVEGRCAQTCCPHPLIEIVRADHDGAGQAHGGSFEGVQVGAGAQYLFEQAQARALSAHAAATDAAHLAVGGGGCFGKGLFAQGGYGGKGLVHGVIWPLAAG